jgi:uncharacterized damage-inducible protein DinB
MRQLLLEELSVAVRTTKGLVNKIKPEHWNYRPKENMRTLLELVHHLVLIPATDFAILQEKSGDEVKDIENALNTTDPQQLCKVLEEGFEALKTYMLGLSDSDFLLKATKPFYLDHASVQAKWLIEIVTHAFHHRSQLYNYLKQLGYPLQFFELY